MSNVTESDLKTAVELSSLAVDLVAERKRLTEAAHRIAELEAERDSIRDKALEEAACLCHDHAYAAADSVGPYATTLLHAGAAIRALKGTKP